MKPSSIKFILPLFKLVINQNVNYQFFSILACAHRPPFIHRQVQYLQIYFYVSWISFCFHLFCLVCLHTTVQKHFSWFCLWCHQRTTQILYQFFFHYFDASHNIADWCSHKFKRFLAVRVVVVGNVLYPDNQLLKCVHTRIQFIYLLDWHWFFSLLSLIIVPIARTYLQANIRSLFIFPEQKFSSIIIQLQSNSILYFGHWSPLDFSKSKAEITFPPIYTVRRTYSFLTYLCDLACISPFIVTIDLYMSQFLAILYSIHIMYILCINRRDLVRIYRK